MKNLFNILILGLALSAASSYADDWPQYLGPDNNNISKETGLLKKWTPSGPKELWSFTLGEGFGGVAIRDGEVYVLDRINNEKDILRCIDLKTGQEKWNFSNTSPGKTGFNGSRTVPTVTEEHVFAVGLMGDFYCVDIKTHKLVWKKNLVSDFNGRRGKWGASQSPFIYKDSVFVAAHGKDIHVVKYDQKTGKEIWKSEGLSPNSPYLYVTPLVLNLAGIDQVVVPASGMVKERDGQTVGLSVDDGKILWSFNHWQSKNPIAPPTYVPDDKLFFTAGYGAGSAMVKIVKAGSGYKAEKVFQLGPECGSQLHIALLYKNHLYLNSNSNEKHDGMTCLTLDGKILWQTKKSPNFEKGNLILADDMIYNLDGKTGMLHLITPDPSGYKEVSSVKMFTSKQMWAPMAISDGRLLLRDQTQLKCLAIKK